MNRWFGIIASFSILASFMLVGCTPPETKPVDDAGATAGNPADSKDTPTKSTGGGTETTTTGTTGTTGGETSSDAPVQDMPKDGDDVAVLETSMGNIVVMFYPSKAPKHVQNFLDLSKKGFYNGTRFHRCIPGFMIQGGDPLSKDMSKSGMWGTGGNMDANGKEINLAAEFNDVSHKRGIMSMARSNDPNSASSQFFIMVADNPGLDGQYTAFGKAIKGMDIADKIVVTGDAGNNGAVVPARAVVLKSVKIVKWPVK